MTHHPQDRRDFIGYGATPPHPEWPGSAKVAVSFVVNVEEGAELSIADGDERNESVHEITELVPERPDLCMESHFAYGTRAGYWRIAALLERYGVRATFSACARSLQRSPWLAKDILSRGHEISAHSYRWEQHHSMAPEDERAVICQTVDAIRAAGGTRPIGWHTRSSSSVNTRRLLVEEGGFLYDSDAYDDDLPRIETVDGTDHVVLPYAFDTNDMRFTNNGGFTFPEDFARYCMGAFDQLYTEGKTAPRMLSIGLHLRMIGRPARIAGLESLLRQMTAYDKVWFARRCDIAHHWRRRMGLPDFEQQDKGRSPVAGGVSNEYL